MLQLRSSHATLSWLFTTVLFLTPAMADQAAAPMDLAQALRLAMERSPELAGDVSETLARQAKAGQAGLRPNPTLKTEIEDFGGSGSRHGFDEAQTTVLVSQLLELGDKRAKRRQSAELEADLANWDYEEKKRAVLGETTKAFVRALAAEKRSELAAELVRVCAESVRAASAQVAAGAAPAIEETRARVALGRSEVARTRAERDLDAARSALAATWGDDAPAFGRLEGRLELPRQLPSFDSLERRLEQSPALARWKTETEEKQAALAVEEAARIPDVTVGAGGRYYSDHDDAAIVVELSVPLPLFDRNQGAIAEARHRLDKTRAEQAAATMARRAALRAAFAELTSAHEQATRLRDSVLPEARRASDQALDTYRRGVFRFLDVVDARQTLFDLRSDYLAAVETFFLQEAEIERLAGSALPESRSEENLK